MSEVVFQKRPRFGRLPKAVAYSGRSRTRLYELAAQYPGLFRKDGDSTIVDFDVLDGILDSLPVAKITPPPEKSPSRARRTSDTS